MATAAEILAGSLPVVADAMNRALTSSRETGDPARVDEAILKRSIRTVAAPVASLEGLGFEAKGANGHAGALAPCRTRRSGVYPGRARAVEAYTYPRFPRAEVGREGCAVELHLGCRQECAREAPRAGRAGARARRLRRDGRVEPPQVRSAIEHARMERRRVPANLRIRLAVLGAAAETHRNTPHGSLRVPLLVLYAVVPRHRFRYDGQAWSLGLIRVEPTSDELIPPDEYGRTL